MFPRVPDDAQTVILHDALLFAIPVHYSSVLRLIIPSIILYEQISLDNVEYGASVS